MADIQKIVENGLSIERFYITPENLLNKGIIFYGPSLSGKTTLIKNCIYAIRNHIQTAIAFAPTNEEKHELDKIIPPMFVYETVDTDVIKDIYERNKAFATVYNQVHSIDTLLPIFKSIASPKDLDIDEYITATTERAIAKADNIGEKQTISEMSKTKRIEFYRNVISKTPANKVPSEYSGLHRHINIKPHTLVLFDDATTEVANAIKKEKTKQEETIKNFFFKGRWAYITHFYAFHDDKNVDTDIRKNAHISIFTDKQIALTYFTRPSHGFSLGQKKIAEKYIKIIFNETGSNAAPKHAKLAYIRETGEFKFVIADLLDNFVLFPQLHTLSLQIKKKDNLSGNKYYRKIIS